MILRALDGSADEIKNAISKAGLLVRYTVGGSPKTKRSIGEEVLLLFNDIASLEQPRAIERCRATWLRLFGGEPAASELRPLMKSMVERALKLAESANPFG